MGCWIEIGNAELEYDQKEEYVDIGVKQIVLPDSPFEINNQMSMSYTHWHEWSQRAFVYSYMYGLNGGNRQSSPDDGSFVLSGRLENGIIEYHPGASVINERDIVFWEKKMAAFKELYPDVKPRFYHSNNDAALARMVWFHYWTKWAVENCERPVIVNG